MNSVFFSLDAGTSMPSVGEGLFSRWTEGFSPKFMQSYPELLQCQILSDKSIESKVRILRKKFQQTCSFFFFAEWKLKKKIKKK